MNHSTISGNITKEPELFSPEGSEWSLVKFSIANNDERKKNKQTGEWESEVSFFDMQYWTKKPQYWLKQLVKGRYVCCPCKAKQDRWDQDGSTRSRVVFNLVGFPEGLPKLEKKSTQEPPPAENFEDGIPF